MKKLSAILYLTVLLLLVGCVSEVDLGLEPQGYTVISGVVTNSFFERNIHVTFHEGLEVEGKRIAATGKVFKNGQFETDLIPFGFGLLTFPISFHLEEGATYEVEISTAGGRTYRSLPQRILPRLQADSISFRTETLVVGKDHRGNALFDRFVTIYAHVNLPDTTGGHRYFRWQADESWSFTEVPNLSDSTDVIKTCYPRLGVEAHPSTLMSTENLQPGPLTIKVAQRALDESFLETHYFSAYLHSITRESYDFYQRAEQLIQNSGTLFDQVPAPVKGNVYNVHDAEDLVYGFVEFSQADTIRLKILNEDIGIFINDPCKAPEPCPDVLTLSGDLVTVPCICFECDEVFGPWTTIKPSYWE